MVIKMDWYKVTNFLILFYKPLNVKIISILGERNGTRNLTITQISGEVRDQEKKVFSHCKRLMEQGFLDCTNNALIQSEKGYVKRQGTIPKFQLSIKGIAAYQIFYFINNYETHVDLKVLEEQIKLSGELREIEDNLVKILERVRQLKKGEDISEE